MGIAYQIRAMRNQKMKDAEIYFKKEWHEPQCPKQEFSFSSVV